MTGAITSFLLLIGNCEKNKIFITTQHITTSTNGEENINTDSECWKKFSVNFPNSMLNVECFMLPKIRRVSMCDSAGDFICLAEIAKEARCDILKDCSGFFKFFLFLLLRRDVEES